MTDLATARDLLGRLVAFPTVSRGPNQALIDWVAQWLAQHGIAATVVADPDQPGKASLFAQVGPDRPGGVVLSGHTDVVPVEGQAWRTDPWTLCERDGRLYGRGTCDMKGFDALALAAMARAAGMALQRPLQIVLSHDEELGCVGCIAVIEALAGLPRAAAVVVGEPTSMQVVTGHKGGLAFWLRVIGHEVHSSIMHTGVNAILEAAKILTWVNEMNARGRAAGTDTPFVPPWTTVHTGEIRGGTAHNITAGLCEFGVDFRLLPGESPEAWRRAFLARVAEVEAGMQAVHPGCRIEVGERFALPGLAPEADGAAEALARAITGDNTPRVVSYGTEAGQFQQRGWSAVICGPGDIEQAHKADEWLDLAQFAAGWAFMEAVLDRLCADA